MKINTRWLQFAAIGAAITATAGLALQFPLPQVAVSSALTAGLILSGYLFQAKGRPERAAQA
jgi:hypothetical protein